MFKSRSFFSTQLSTVTLTLFFMAASLGLSTAYAGDPTSGPETSTSELIAEGLEKGRFDKATARLFLAYAKDGKPGQEASSANLPTPALIARDLALGHINAAKANLYMAYALGDYEKLPREYYSKVPWHGTLAFLYLSEAASAMSPNSEKAQIDQLRESGACGSSGGVLPSTTNSAYFHIEYGPIEGGLSINDYSTSLDTAWKTEVNTFGWAAPPVLAGNPPAGNLYHVRIDALSPGLFGYVANSGVHAGSVGDNPNTSWNDGDASATCMVINSDLSFAPSAQAALGSTTSHEFNHSIQFGYGALSSTAGGQTPDDHFVEGGATWIEDEVFDSVNDNYNYLWPDFTQSMGSYTGTSYAYWIVFRGLTEPFGTGTAGAGEQVMQDFWEDISMGSSGSSIAALDSALRNKNTNLANAYHAFAIAVKFNKACGGGYVFPYCLEEGPDYVAIAGATTVTGAIGSVGSTYTGDIADSYALNWISLPKSGPYNVTLQNISGGGSLRCAVVCDTGTALNLHALSSVVNGGNSGSLAGFDPSGCSSVVAVITNQSTATSSTARSYTISATQSGPIADITGNGSDGPITITQTDTLSVKVSLNAAGQTNNSDWWCVYSDPNNQWHYLDLSSFTFKPGMVVSNQGVLFDLGAYQVFNSSLASAGSYTFYFGVDTTPDGAVAMNSVYYDTLVVNVR